MSETNSPPRPYHSLTQVTTVVLLFQAVFLIAQLFEDGAYSGAMTGMLAATVALSAVNRRIIADPQGSHASGYVAAWRYGALALLGVLSVVVALRAYVPQATPKGTPTVVAMLVSALIALKGAALGKLKPGGVLGLRLPWTCQSRLAWEKAHRLMGRILFPAGLIGLLAAPFVPFAAVLAGIAALVLVALTAGAIESWQVWRNDPDRSAAGRGGAP